MFHLEEPVGVVEGLRRALFSARTKDEVVETAAAVGPGPARREADVHEKVAADDVTVGRLEECRPSAFKDGRIWRWLIGRNAVPKRGTRS